MVGFEPAGAACEVVWNSATSPLPMAVLVWLARTLRSPATALAPARMVCGSVPVAVVRSWPRKPSTPGTPDQSSLVVMSEVFDQFCEKGGGCGALEARATRGG